jgi:hypothetical protein
MIGILLGVLGTLALFSWVVALISAIRVVSLAPKGKKFSVYGKLGWWKFDDIRALIGPTVEPHIRTYQRAFVAFIACVIISIVGGGLLSAVAQN